MNVQDTADKAMMLNKTKTFILLLQNNICYLN